jgi:esterase/lipase superfamily enzyme
VQRSYHTWHSAALDRPMELLVFGDRGARVVVFPTRDGRFFDYENWGMVGAAAWKIEQGFLQLICVDSVDRESLYADWASPPDRLKRHLQYERYILDEVLPFSEERNSNPFMIAHGCSLGAYHAVNLAFRNPRRFGKVVALSGRYDLTTEVGAFRDLFDGWRDDELFRNCPSLFVPSLGDEAILEDLRRLEITVVVGQEDAFLENNVEFSEALSRQRIPHQFYVWEGEAHRPRYWRRMVDLYL